MEHVDIIIRTTAEPHRHESLERAIDSILDQRNMVARPIVVANGNRYDPGILSALSSRSDILFTHFEPGSTGRAMRVGRSLVSAPYFAFLDDDDTLLPDSAWLRHQAFQDQPDTDLVVSNGYLVSPDGGTSIDIDDLLSCQKNPLASIIQKCWLDPCGGLFKTSRITPDFFDASVNYHEWTYLAFCIAQKNLKTLFIDSPLYLRNDTPDSLSKSVAYSTAMLDVLQRMRQYSVPKDVHKKIEHKYHNALHVHAQRLHAAGKYAMAWKYHLMSMKPPHTLKYASYTRKIILP